MSEKVYTAIIFNQFEMGLKFLLIEGDMSRFDGIYINAAYEIEEKEKSLLQDELNNIVYPFHHNSYPDGKMFRECTKDEFREAVKNGSQLIECGFIP